MKVVASAIAARERVLSEFLEAEQDRIARACYDMAKAFNAGATLIPYGHGAAASDAAHVAVEFMHPVIVGKRALPAVADPRIGRAGDIALAISHGASDAKAAAFLKAATARGLLTIAFTAGEQADADHVLAVHSDDPVLVQEVQETAYHVLWELVHVFFEHPGLLNDSCITCGDVAVEVDVVEVYGDTAVVARGGARETVAIELVPDVGPGDRLLAHAGVALEKLEGESTAFLYPFLEREEDDLEAVLADVRRSTVAKGGDVIALRRGIDVDAVERAGTALRERLDAGGRLFTFGNGGSATDAQDMAIDAVERGWPAVALTADSATVTAVANDVGFDNVYSRQLIALASARDVAVGISTSGASGNVLAGLEEAHGRGLMTIAIAGYGGGRMAELPWLDHLLVVDGDYVPRLQEAQATIYHLLLCAS